MKMDGKLISIYFCNKSVKICHCCDSVMLLIREKKERRRFLPDSIKSPNLLFPQLLSSRISLWRAGINLRIYHFKLLRFVLGNIESNC